MGETDSDRKGGLGVGTGHEYISRLITGQVCFSAYDPLSFITHQRVFRREEERRPFASSAVLFPGTCPRSSMFLVSDGQPKSNSVVAIL